MASKSFYSRADLDRLDLIQQVERPPANMRWWVALPLGVGLSAAQAIASMMFEHLKPVGVHLTNTQLSILAFGFLGILLLCVNPLLRLTRVIRPLNRAEIMTVFAALFVSGGIAGVGLVDWLLPLIAAPFNEQWNTPQREWDKDILPHLNAQLFITDTTVIREFREGFPHQTGIWQKIPWAQWIRPLGFWMIFVFAIYLMFYALAALLFGSWAKREKLVFPLARLPEAMLEHENSMSGRLPPIVRSPYFLAGFFIAFIILSYNACCMAGWFSGLQPLTLGVPWVTFRGMFDATIFKGISDWGSHRLCLIFTFTTVGIGFLLPLEITASLWIYHLTGLGIFMVAIWTAVGTSTASWPSDWLTENNFVSSLGGGGLLAYAASYLVKLAMEKWAGVREMSPRQSLAGALLSWVRSFGWGAVMLLLSLSLALAWLKWSGVGLLWGAIFLASIMFITIAFMRMICESGLFIMQGATGPFHYAKLAGGAAAAPASAFAVLLPVYSTMFVETVAFMSPAIMNSFKMQDETRAPRKLFHLVVVLSIIVTVVVSVAAMLLIVYSVGANSASSWTFGGTALNTLDTAQRMISGEIFEKSNANLIFHFIGFGWVILSILMRRRFFWWLHPIGIIALCNTFMQTLWLGFFIGWACKKAAVRYGGRHMFDRLRPAFIGLIIGEITACFVWAVLSYALGLDQVTITLFPWM